MHGGNKRSYMRVLLVTKLVNTKLKEKVVSLEQQTWSNSQCCRWECLELSGIPETVEIRI